MEILNVSAYANARAYYRLEANGNDSKNSYNLSSGSPTYAAAKYGNGAVCTSDFVTASTSLGGLMDGSNWSIAVWYKWAGGNNDDRPIVATTSSVNDVSGGITYQYNGGTRRLQFWRDRIGPGTASAYYNITLDTSLFHLLVITYDGTNILGYYDGAEVASTTQSGTGTNPGSDKASVGGAGTTSCNGTVDDACFFASTLTAAQIQEIYHEAGGSFLFNIL